MTILDAIILGIIQGVTEFLPISSSGHLVLLPTLFAMPSPDLALVAVVHLGTLVAILIYFRRTLWDIVSAVFVGLQQREPFGSVEARLGWYIAVGSVPAAVAGLSLEGFFEDLFGTPAAAASFLLGTAVLLVVGERLLAGDKPLHNMSWVDAIIIGLFQMLALFPGISRSGSTIVGGLLRGLDRSAAARYSFLLGTPAILGAGVLQLADLVASDSLIQQLPVLVVSFLTAAVSGYGCIYFLLSWLRQHSLYIFAAYCGIFGVIYLVFFV